MLVVIVKYMKFNANVFKTLNIEYNVTASLRVISPYKHIYKYFLLIVYQITSANIFENTSVRNIQI